MVDNLRRWPTGEAEIGTMVDSGRLERVPGNPQYTAELIDRCERKLRSALLLVDDDPESAYTLAYDAARFLLTSLLAAQGLRPKGGSDGGHLLVQEAIEAQFPGRFTYFRHMRRTRNDLEYPSLTEAAETVDTTDSRERITQIDQSVAPVRQLVENLPKFN